MRHFIVAPLTLVAGLALLSIGCSNSTKDTAPVTNVPKPTQMEMNTGKGPAAPPNTAGRSGRTLE